MSTAPIRAHTFASFESFWRYYLGEHASAPNRALHLLGTTAALATVGLAVARRRPSLLLLAALVGYGPAWVGHFLIEGNRPATFAHPLWSLRADLKMLALAARGRLADELRRSGISPRPRLTRSKRLIRS